MSWNVLRTAPVAECKKPFRVPRIDEIRSVNDWVVGLATAREADGVTEGDGVAEVDGVLDAEGVADADGVDETDGVTDGDGVPDTEVDGVGVGVILEDGDGVGVTGSGFKLVSSMIPFWIA